MEHVAQILAQKGGDVWSVSPDSTIYQALEYMAEKGIGAVLVADGDSIVGILSERDYARKVVLAGKSSKDTPVKEIMTTDVISVELNTPVNECMALMTEKHIRHLPVMNNNKLAGIVSIGDIVKAIISNKEFTIEQLQKYIHG